MTHTPFIIDLNRAIVFGIRLRVPNKQGEAAIDTQPKIKLLTTGSS
ncbi:hypothetical protein HACA111877_15345 [Halomonas casei]